MCNKCGKSSAKGHCGGTRERWFCEPCGYDLCFECLPRAPADSLSKVRPRLLICSTPPMYRLKRRQRHLYRARTELSYV